MTPKKPLNVPASRRWDQGFHIHEPRQCVLFERAETAAKWAQRATEAGFPCYAFQFADGIWAYERN